MFRRVVAGWPGEVLLLADTHVPRRARDLPTRVWTRWRRPTSPTCRRLVEPELLDELTARAARLVDDVSAARPKRRRHVRSRTQYARFGCPSTPRVARPWPSAHRATRFHPVAGM